MLCWPCGEISSYNLNKIMQQELAKNINLCEEVENYLGHKDGFFRRVFTFYHIASIYLYMQLKIEDKR